MFHCITNLSAGVGKTTLAVYLATAVALLTEEPVLLIDTDPQNAAGKVMGFADEQLRQASIESYLQHGGCVLDYVLERDEFLGCHLLSSGHYDLVLTERGERGAVDWVDFLIEVASLPYRHVFFDTPPAFGVIQQLCLRACESVLIPVRPGYLQLEGLKSFVTSIYRCLQGWSTPLESLRIVVNCWQKYDSSALSHLRKGMRGLVMETMIPYSSWFPLCAAEGLNLLERIENPSLLQFVYDLAKEYLDSLAVGEQGRQNLSADPI